MTTLLQTHNLTKHYQGETVLNDVSLALHEGEVKGIMGPSGAGKSTLIRCLNGLVPVDAGDIYLGDQRLGDKQTNMDKVRSRIGFVFQDFNLYTHLTVKRNVTIALRKVQHKSKAEAEEIAYKELARVGLEDKLEAYPAELSGGQQQRASIARALAMKPQLMLFDEPTSALDPESVGGVLRVMRELVQEGMTMIIVSHEMAFIQAVADDVIFMVDGSVLESGTSKQVFEQPQNQRTREFIQGLATEAVGASEDPAN